MFRTRSKIFVSEPTPDNLKASEIFQTLDSRERGFLNKMLPPSSLALSPSKAGREDSGRPATLTAGVALDAGRTSDGSVCLMVR